MKKLPIINEKDLDALIVEALKGNGVLTTPNEVSQMITNIKGISINSKPRKDGRWQGYIEEGNEKRYIYGKSKDEVAIKIKEYLRNGLPQKKKEKNTINGIPTTFNAFAQYYFKNFRIKKVAEQTFKTDMSRYKCHILPVLGELPLKKITPQLCQNLIDDISNKGKGKTADEIYSLLSVIFKTAIKHNIISHNPLDVIYHEKHIRNNGTALTNEERIKLINDLKNKRAYYTVILMLYTGLRPNEVKTARIDGEMIIAKNSKRKTKQVEYKRIPIAKDLKPFLKNGIITTSLNYLETLIKNSLPNHKLYDLRTTFYSRCKECGISEHAREEMVGHSLGDLGNAYTSLSDTFLIQEMQKFTYENKDF